MLKNNTQNLRKLANAHLWIVQNPMTTTVLGRSGEILHHFIINFDEPLDSDSRPNEAQTSLLTDDDWEFEFKGLFVDHEGTSDQAGGSVRKMRIALHPEVDVVAAGEACENLTLLIHVKAPSASEASKKQNYEDCEGNTVKDPSCRAPIDLVTVLDVSGSMSGTKLALLKRAMAFVISNLSPEDRLFVFVFSSTAKRVLPLKRMSPDDQHAANRVVECLLCTSGTNIAEGLRKGVKVLEDPCHYNVENKTQWQRNKRKI